MFYIGDAPTAEAPKATRKKAAPPKEVVVEPEGEAEVDEEVVEEDDEPEEFGLYVLKNSIHDGSSEVGSDT